MRTFKQSVGLACGHDTNRESSESESADNASTNNDNAFQGTGVRH